MFDGQVNRRDFMKRMAYVVPVILSLNAIPAFASAGSGNNGWEMGMTRSLPAIHLLTTAPERPRKSR